MAKSGMIEESSLLALVQALPSYACLASGEATAGYPSSFFPILFWAWKPAGKPATSLAFPFQGLRRAEASFVVLY